MNDRFAQALERLSRLPGVRGALLVDAEAGLPVLADLADEMAGPAAAALAASAYRRTHRAVDGVGLGTIEALQLDAAEGHVLVAGAGELLVVVIAEPDAQLGRVRVETRQVAEALL
ncbi:MAG TPA: roadblock/LC7 domain-containing protein [Longimicrobiales bacterium]